MYLPWVMAQLGNLRRQIILTTHSVICREVWSNFSKLLNCRGTSWLRPARENFRSCAQPYSSCRSPRSMSGYPALKVASSQTEGALRDSDFGFVTVKLWTTADRKLNGLHQNTERRHIENVFRLRCCKNLQHIFLLILISLSEVESHLKTRGWEKNFYYYLTEINVFVCLKF